MRPFINPNFAYAQFQRKPADQSVSNSAALVNDLDLGLYIGPLEEWTASYFLDVGAALATTGIKIALNTPSGSTINLAAQLVPDIYTTANLGSKRTTSIVTAMDWVIATQASVGNAGIIVSAWVLNGALAGAINLQFAQSTSSGTAVTLRAGSYVTAQRVA